LNSFDHNQMPNVVRAVNESRIESLRFVML